MKKNLLLAIAVLLAAMVGVSCSNDTHDETAPATEAASDVAFIESLGYDVSDIVSTDLGYLVEGDLLFTPETVESLRSTPQTRHTSWSPFVDKQYQKNIYLTIGSMNEVGYLEAAISEWNALADFNINFVEGAGVATIMIAEFAFPGLPAITVVSPVNGKPATYIYFNPTHTDYTGASAAQKKYMWMHALGHAIGFGHTPNSISEGVEAGSTQIEGTVEFNGSSIMRRDESPFTWEGFSVQDREAFATVYPYKKALYLSWYQKSIVLNGPTGWVPATSLITNSAYKAVITFDPDYLIDRGEIVCCGIYDMSGEVIYGINAFGREFTLSFSEIGTYAVKLELMADIREVSYTEEYTINVKNLQAGNPGDWEIGGPAIKP